MDGVLRTRVGYCGGTTDGPTYRNIGDHAETIQIDFDPKRISYEQLLEVFWTEHNPCGAVWSRQYMSAVFWHDDAQREAIERTKRRLVKDTDAVTTAIVPLRRFWLAEDYHQKYRLQHEPELADELVAIYGSERALVESTAAARLNGWLDGYGTKQQLEREIARLGLSKRGQERLRQLTR